MAKPPGSHDEQPITALLHPAALWTGWAAGPLAWAAHEVGGFALGRFACSSIHPFYWLLTGLTGAVALAALCLTWTNLGRSRRLHEKIDERRYARIRFMTWIGLSFSTVSCIAIAAESATALVNSPC